MAFVCMKDETQGGYTALCKNSNGNPNETHEVVIVPEIKIDDSTIIECTYTTVSPPKSHSHRCLLSKPVWMWGAAMGSNDAGVCIGNEIVRSNSVAKSQHRNHNDNNHLTGMDLVRLALMFGDSALDSVKIIDHYLQNYEQNGSMEWMNDVGTTYYSTFLIADYNEVWIVESINQWFVAKKYCHGVHVISSRYRLSSPFDMISTRLRDYCDEEYIDWEHNLDINHEFGEWKQKYYNRQCFIEKKLNKILIKRKLDINDFCNILRNDNNNNGLLGELYGAIRSVNSNGSLICIMRRDGTVLNLVTATSAPCISVFKPIYIGCSIPKNLGVEFRKYRNGNFVNLSFKKDFDSLFKNKKDIISTENMLLFNAKYNKNHLWWKHSVFHRLYSLYFINDQRFNDYIKKKINKFEEKMFKKLIEQYNEYNSIHWNKQQKVCDEYWIESYNILDEMMKYTQNNIINANYDWKLTQYLHKLQWNHWNKLAGICISKDGVLSDSSSNKSPVLSIFNAINLLRFIKILFASIWSVLFVGIAWKMLS